MLSLFWNSEGPIVKHYQEKGKTINSEHYCSLLTENPKPVICKIRRGMLSQTVILQHDNVRPHFACNTVNTIRSSKFELLEHSYSPDLAPSYYHLFEPSKEATKGVHYFNDEEVKNAVQF